MTLEELRQVYYSLNECVPDEEDFAWGPTYELAMKRRDNALRILRKAIELADQ